MRKFFPLPLATLVLFMAPLTARAAEIGEAELRSCVSRFVLESDPQRIDFNGHEFVCKGKSGWKTTDGVTLVKGQLSHHLSGRPDDQVNWSAKITAEGAVEDVKIEIKRGGAGKWLSWPARAVLAYYGKPVSEETMTTFFRESGKLWDGEWETTAELVVAGIASSLAQSRAEIRNVREFKRRPMFYYQYAPRETAKPYRWSNSDSIYDCRRACLDDESCKVWSYENRTLPNSSNRKLFCSLYTDDRVDGTRPQMRTISGRARD